MPIEPHDTGTLPGDGDRAVTGTTTYREIDIGERVTRAYQPDVWRAAADELLKNFGPTLAGVKHRTAALSAVCRRLVEDAGEFAEAAHGP